MFIIYNVSILSTIVKPRPNHGDGDLDSGFTSSWPHA